MHMFEKHRIIFTLGAFLILGTPLYCQAEEPNCQAALESLKSTSLTEYAASNLDEISKNLKTFSKGVIETKDEDESQHELIRILKTTRSKYEALNHYVYGWNTTMEYQYRANIEAVKRGIEISRTFIISNDMLLSPEKLQNLLSILETQKKDGIKVYFGLQRELEKDPDYHKYTLLDAGLSDNAVYVSVTAVSINGPQPAHVKITWDKNTIEKLNPFPYLRKTPYIHPFDENAKNKLLGLLKDAGP